MTPEMLAALFREHNTPALATLIRVVGDFDLAEDALQEAWLSASEAWQRGVPANASAWLITAARRKAIDRLRREATGVCKLAEVAREMPTFWEDQPAEEPDTTLGDDRLRLLHALRMVREDDEATAPAVVVHEADERSARLEDDARKLRVLVFGRSAVGTCCICRRIRCGRGWATERRAMRRRAGRSP